MSVTRLLLVAVLLLSTFARGETVRVEVFGGTALDLPTPLSIRQNGQQDINLWAQYSTRPFDPGAAPYYAWRVGLWDDKTDTAWEFEHIHDKIYLDNMPPEVQQFRATFGFNMFFINRAWKYNDWLIFRVGAGPVVAHPISEVRGQGFPEEGGAIYYLVGGAVQVAAQAQQPIVGPIFGSAEVKWTNAFAVLPIANGSAITPNSAFHFLLGIGCDF